MSRPTKYDPERSPALVLALARRGCNLEQIAEGLGVTVDTVCRWRKRHPEFSEALKEGRDKANADVENELWNLATGNATQVETRTRKVRDKSGKVVETIEETHEKRLPPSMAAQAFWLKNRAGWADNPEGDADGGPAVTVVLGTEVRPIAHD